MTFMHFIPCAFTRTPNPIEILTNTTYCDTLCITFCNTWRPIMPALSLRLPEDLDHRLGDEARLEGLPRSEVVRQAISDFLARREKERFMAELVAAAKAMSQNAAAMRESRELAEEFLPLDNEALDIAEGRKPGEPVPD